MVWSAADRDDFVADVRAMRRRVEEHIRADHADRELKLGRGGLRDVEFAVQLLQLVHGRGDETLRGPNTLEALAALADGGYVGRDDAANLAASYRFLRLLEHRVQLQRMRRTHLFPPTTTPAALRWLARAAKLRPDGAARRRRRARSTSAPGTTVRVRRLHEKLFYRPLLESVARVPGEALVLTESSAIGAARGAGLDLAAGRAQAPAGPDLRGQPRAAASSARCCRCCSTSSAAPPTPTTGCWPTGRSPRRSPTPRGSWATCATRASPPSG